MYLLTSNLRLASTAACNSASLGRSGIVAPGRRPSPISGMNSCACRMNSSCTVTAVLYWKKSHGSASKEAFIRDPNKVAKRNSHAFSAWGAGNADTGNQYREHFVMLLARRHGRSSLVRSAGASLDCRAALLEVDSSGMIQNVLIRTA